MADVGRLLSAVSGGSEEKTSLPKLEEFRFVTTDVRGEISLWALTDSRQLSPSTREIIADEANEVLISVVSAWEMAVKRAWGKLRAPDDLTEVLADAEFIQRLVRFSDCDSLTTLPSIHRDPFDRLLVCQAIADGIPIVTKNETIANYAVQTI